ncbi:hypothetical protein HYPSUDRAFT_36559 [Hypholoma sublateritium FD-334 SS-4]|uniref:F-box domain-containing protein n=1 Tax=Hypholoma sublateritium (strain FD-334 SS-4) TaxID=945553 RepID=A0A0D2LFA8_HYPSF|nr:hypothetical protein HYPSUDRAFT_36559 [Hypholoma sublateritium FD-334 SS-4]
MPDMIPSDVFDQILNHIDDPIDILNFALSSKALYSVAVPRHLHYRDIRTPLYNPSLWASLYRKDDIRASHIHSLTILPDTVYDLMKTMIPCKDYDIRKRLDPNSTPYEPMIWDPDRGMDEYVEAEDSMISALERMVCLRRFAWYRVERPFFSGGNDLWTALRNLGTIEEIDIYEGNYHRRSSESPPITASSTFFTFLGLTTLKIRTDNFSIHGPNGPSLPLMLEYMLLNNLPDLEVLVLEIEVRNELDRTANVDHILQSAHWPRLRVLRFYGTSCRVAPLTRFLADHPSLEELALAKMMPGRLWPQLAANLPHDALPNLRHLECAPHQAAALLENLRPRLETLLGINLQTEVRDSNYFSFFDEIVFPSSREAAEFYERAEETRASSWRDLLLRGLERHRTITRLGLSLIHSVVEAAEFAVIAPQTSEIDIEFEANGRIPETELFSMYALFPALEVVHVYCLMMLPIGPLTPESWVPMNNRVQAFARACPRLRVIWAVDMKKLVIIRDDKDIKLCGVKWVIRPWTANEEPEARSGETVFGP